MAHTYESVMRRYYPQLWKRVEPMITPRKAAPVQAQAQPSPQVAPRRNLFTEALNPWRLFQRAALPRKVESDYSPLVFPLMMHELSSSFFLQAQNLNVMVSLVCACLGILSELAEKEDVFVNRMGRDLR